MLARAPSNKGPSLAAGCSQSGGALQTRVQSIGTRRAAGSSQAPLANVAGAGSAAVAVTGRRASRLARLPNLSVAAQAGSGGKGSGGTDEEPDWEAEMSIFNQRISRPNQLATLRELEAKTAVGKVRRRRRGRGGGKGSVGGFVGIAGGSALR